MIKVKKRNGDIVEYDSEKISMVIKLSIMRAEFGTDNTLVE